MIAKRIMYVLFFLSFGSASCVKRVEEARPCVDISFKRLYAWIGSNNGNVSYSHYVQIKGYSERCFNHTNFYEIAEGYIDSCKTDLPVDEVRFMKSGEEMGFDNNELDMNKIDDATIMGFSVSSGKITAVEIAQGGVIKRVDISDCKWNER